MPEKKSHRIHEQASIGFQRAADAYERGRPEYPRAAVDHLLKTLRIAPTSRVVELGAGTGKFTKAIFSSGADIIAVEPVEAMRNKLAELIPGITIVDGTAEAIPLADGFADAVVVAQAFHWFRGEEALAEIHRILKPGAGLGLIWNVRDESVGWIGGLTKIIEPYEGSAPRYKSFAWKAPFESSRLFSPLARAEFANLQTLSTDAIEDRVLSISFIAALPEAERNSVRGKIRELVRNEAEARGLREVDFPYRTDVYTCRRI
jgi:SAM-dependent methyltransferase